MQAPDVGPLRAMMFLAVIGLVVIVAAVFAGLFWLYSMAFS